MINITHFSLRFVNCTCWSLRKFSTKPRVTSEKWKSVVGLEIHAQINSESKLFSGGSTCFGEPVNSCVSYFDCATPGTLPVLNKKCVEAGVFTALALSCQLNEVSLFDRKHYFYADLPTGYQITQQRQPLAINGELKFNVFTPGVHKELYVKSSKIKQIQLEQDSGKSLHDNLTRRSLIDLNRAGIPLMELVFEPDLTDGEEAAALVKELMIILERLNTCSCKMGEGALRVDANISVNKENEPLGVRTEVKNIGSIRAVNSAIKYEIARQIKLLEQGGQVVKETLGWDAEKQKTILMRDKESQQDYRFMPEPNLPPLRLDMTKDSMNDRNLVNVNSLFLQLPELPEETRQCFIKNFGLTTQSAIAIVNNGTLTKLFKDIMSENHKRNPKTVANVLLMELMEFVNKNKFQLETLNLSSSQLGELIDLLESQTINLDTAKKVLSLLADNCNTTAAEIVEQNQWSQISNDEKLTKLAQSIIIDNPKVVAQYKNGKTKVFRALLGEAMKRTNGHANMGKMSKILLDLLK